MSTKTRRPTIGTDPLDALLTPSVKREPIKREPSRVPLKKPEPAASSPRPSRKVRATYNIPEDLVEGARDAVVALAGPPVRLTLAALVENALRRELERLRKSHNAGKPFPVYGAALKGGRPIR